VRSKSHTNITIEINNVNHTDFLIMDSTRSPITGEPLMEENEWKPHGLPHHGQHKIFHNRGAFDGGKRTKIYFGTTNQSTPIMEEIWDEDP
jgi:hypothetical protein